MIARLLGHRSIFPRGRPQTGPVRAQSRSEAGNGNSLPVARKARVQRRTGDRCNGLLSEALGDSRDTSTLQVVVAVLGPPFHHRQRTQARCAHRPGPLPRAWLPHRRGTSAAWRWDRMVSAPLRPTAPHSRSPITIARFIALELNDLLGVLFALWRIAVAAPAAPNVQHTQKSPVLSEPRHDVR